MAINTYYRIIRIIRIILQRIHNSCFSGVISDDEHDTGDRHYMPHGVPALEASVTGNAGKHCSNLK